MSTPATCIPCENYISIVFGDSCHGLRSAAALQATCPISSSRPGLKLALLACSQLPGTFAGRGQRHVALQSALTARGDRERRAFAFAGQGPFKLKRGQEAHVYRRDRSPGVPLRR